MEKSLCISFTLKFCPFAIIFGGLLPSQLNSTHSVYNLERLWCCLWVYLLFVKPADRQREAFTLGSRTQAESLCLSGPVWLVHFYCAYSPWAASSGSGVETWTICTSFPAWWGVKLLTTQTLVHQQCSWPAHSFFTTHRHSSKVKQWQRWRKK